MQSVYIIDASGYLYRSYFAIKGMTNSQGASTNALFGFIRSLQKLIKDFQPNHLVAVFDGPKSIKKRKELYPDYKANRAKMPEDLREQIGWAQEYCDLVGFSKLVIPEVEADDTMGAVAKWAKGQGADVFLCTSDKDMCQLVDEKVHILNTHKDNLIMGPKEVEEKFGVPPNKIIDLLAITGDSSDNVPGLPGIGPKTAQQLIEQFGSLEELLARPDEVSGKKRQETIRNEADKAHISRQLVIIDTEVEIPRETADYALKPPQIESLRDFYQQMSFHSLLREMEEILQGEAPQEELSYTCLDEAASFAELITYLSKHKEICFDTETTDLLPMEAELVGVGFCVEKGKAFYVPVNGNLGLEYVLKGIQPLLENPEISFYGHNLKYDWHIMQNYGINIHSISFDTILASYILNSHNRQHGLDPLCLEYFGKVKIKTSDLLGKGKKAITMREVPIEKVSEYCCEDVDYTYRLKELLQKELEERNLTHLLQEIELPLMRVLGKMERHGLFIDLPHLRTMGEKVKEQIEQLEEEIFSLAGEPFNLNSPKQLSEILFGKLGIKPIKKTTTGFSTNAAVLEILKQEHPIAEKILEYRTLEKLRSTYIEALPLQVNPKTKRIHPTFIQFVTATGRLSCQDPNLQNIPVRSKIGKQIRAAFRPKETGWSYISADYSQIELRILAHFSEDPSLLAGFRENRDIHTHTAAGIFGIPLEAVTSEMRHQAKAVNFGIIYGQQAFGLAQELGIEVKEAAAFIEKYFTRYSNVQAFLEECKEKARKTGKAVTLFGRERAIPEIESKNMQIRQAAERLAVNTPFQGSNADIIKKAMLQFNKELKQRQPKGSLILQIHDELICEVPDEEIDLFASLLKETMEGVVSLKVPLTVDIKIGKNWKECYD